MKKRPAVKFFVLASSLSLLLGSFSMAHAQSETKSPLQISAIQTGNVFVGVAHDFSRDIVRPLLAVPAETLNFIVSFRNNTSFTTFTRVSNQAAVASSNIFVNLWNSIFGDEDVPPVVEKETVTPTPSTPREPVIVTPVPGFPPSSTATTIVKTVSTNSSELASLRNNISSLTSRIYALENRPSTIVNNYVADQTASLGDSISRLITSNNTNVINNITNVGGSSVDQSNMAITGGTITGVNATTTDLNVTGNLSFDGLYGSAGQVLTSQGTSTTPTWETVSGGGSVATSTIRNMFTASSPLAFSTTTGAFSVASNYSIPLTASTTEWTSGYNNRITSVTNSDGTLTISPTTGAVVASRAAITGDVTIALGSNTSVYAGTLPATKGGFGLSQVRTDISTLTVINNQAVTTGWLNFTGGSNNELTGLVAQADGTTVRISKDRSSGNNIQIAFEDARSTAANRIVGASGSARLLTAGQSLTLVYSTAASRWIVVDSNASADESHFGYVSTGAQSWAGAKTFKSDSISAVSSNAVLYDNSNNGSLNWGSRVAFDSSVTESILWGTKQLKSGGNIIVDWSGTPNGSASLSFDGSEAQFLGQTRFGGDMDDSSGNKFLDPYNRVLYASDGSTSMLDFLNASSAGVLFNSSGTFTGRLGSASEAFYGTGTGGSVYLVDGTYAINSTGPVKLTGLANYYSGSYALCISSSGYVTTVEGDTCSASSARFKHNIEDLDTLKGLDLVNALRPVSFTYNDSNNESLGFIAEEVNLLDPRFVFYEKDGVTPRGINYDRFTPIFAKAIQQLSDIGTYLADKIVSIKEATIGILRIGDQICADDVCVTKEQFKQILLNGGGVATTPPTVSSDPVVIEPDTGTTTEPTVIPDPIVEEPSPEVAPEPAPTAEPAPEVVPEPAPAPEPAPTE